MGCMYTKGNEKYFITKAYLLDQLFHPAIHTGQYYLRRIKYLSHANILKAFSFLHTTHLC